MTTSHFFRSSLTTFASKSGKGFTLIEMMVSVTLFAVVMLVAVGALLALTNANRKAQALQSVMNNLSISLDGMVRAIRMGSTYHCGASGSYTNVQDCPAGDTLLAIEPYGGDQSDPSDQVVYSFVGGRILRSITGGSSPSPLTAPEITINNVTFYVVGTEPARQNPADRNFVEPKVVISLKGTAGTIGNARTSTRTEFHVQATAVQRHLDL